MNDIQVLFVMPTWQSASELWMERMIEAMDGHLVAIAALHPGASHWRGRVPSIDIGDPAPALWRRVCRRVGLPEYRIRRRTGEDALRAAVERPDVTVVLVHYIEFAMRYWNVWARTSKRVYVYCHGYDVTWDLRPHESPDTHSLPVDYRNRVRNFAGRVTFIANSHTTADKLKAMGVPESGIIVRHYGVPVPDSPAVKSRSAKAVNILYLGRLVDFKGPDLVIRAFDLACRQGFDGTLTLAGDGPMRVTCELLRRESAFADRIKIPGTVSAEQGESLRSAADIFTAHNRTGPLSRQEEAFGVSIVEAMASALPVITGRSGGVMETVVDGETGILVTPGNVEEHASAFLKLGRDPELRCSMGQAGWNRAKHCFVKERDSLLRVLAKAPAGAAPTPGKVPGTDSSGVGRMSPSA